MMKRKARHGLHLPQAILLDARVIRIVHIVDAHDRVSIPDEEFRGARTNKTCRTCN